MPDTFPLYKAADFNTYTLALATGTATGTQTWTLVEAFASNFPTEFPIIAGVFSADDTLFSSSKEFILISGNSAPSRQITVSTRAIAPTTISNHLPGDRVRLLLTGIAWNNLIDELRTVRTMAESKVLQSAYNTLLAQGNVPITTTITTGEAYTATTTDGSVTGPTLLTVSGTQWVKALGTTEALGSCEVFGVAFEESTLSGQTKRIYLPGQIVGGFTGLTLNTRYFPSASVAGGWSTAVPTHWRVVGVAVSATQMFICEGKMSSALIPPGTTGTPAANAGTSTRASRSDHEHKVIRDYTPIIQAPTNGAVSFPFVNISGLTLEVTGFYAECNGTTGSTMTTIALQKTNQAAIDSGVPSWSTVSSPNLTIDANEWSSQTATTPAGISGITIAPGERIRVQVPTAGTGVGDLGIFVQFKSKNTN